MHTLFDTVPRLHSHTLDIFVLGTALLLGTALYVTRKDKLRRRGLPYPPGPPGLPLIGNVFDMPSAYEWIVYRDWSRKYNSAVVHVSMPGTHLVVVNSAKAANDLFDKRSSIYSDRPSLTSLTEYLGFDWTIGSIPYSAKWRSARRGFHAHFHPSAARAYEPLETAAAHELLRNLLESPENFLQHTRHTAGKVILRIAYGIEALPQNDPFVALAEQAVHSIALGTKLGGRIFDLVPILKRMPWWVPGAGFKREALKWRPIVRRMVEEPFSFTRAAVDKGNAPFSVAANIINQGILDPELRAPKELPANIYVGGTDTTVTAFQTFILAMVLYPEAQRKAQAEIDAVIGSSRLPTFADEKDLPYVGALAKEIQRWHPVVPLAIPHRLTEDDVYEGCFIPAGTTVIGNAWAILHDPALFPDPESFKPEHFLPAEEGGTFTPSAGRYTESAFGFGRRECPGRYMARASVWIAAATVLAAFDISPARDEQGNIIPAEEKYTSGFITHPEPFKCTIKPRSQAARELILATADEWA